MAKSKKSGFWIQINSLETAREAASQGCWAAGLVAALTGVLTILALTIGLPEGFPTVDAWAFWDAGFFAAIAWGIHKMSRVAAVCGLGLYLLEQIILRVSSPDLAAGGLLVAGLFILAFINGIRGTFAYHQLRRNR